MKQKSSLPVFIVVLFIFGGCVGHHKPKPRLKLGETIQGEIIEAIGEVLIDEADIAKTKRLSLIEAQKKAIEKVVGLHISAKTLIEKAITIEQRILSQSDGYIKKYDIIDEWIEKPFYKTKIRALVLYQKITNDLDGLGLLQKPQVANPRIAVILKGNTENNLTDNKIIIANNSLIQPLLDKDYYIINTKHQGAVSKRKSLSELGALAKELDVGILILGTVQGQFVTGFDLAGLVSFRTAINVEVYKTQTNEVIMTMNKSASGVDIINDMAIEKALKSAGGQIGEELAKKLAHTLAMKSIISLSISGINSLNQIEDMEKFISSISGVNNFFLRSFGNGKAVIDLHIENIGVKDIAQIFEKNSYPKIKVNRLTQNSIKCNLGFFAHPPGL